MEDFEASMKGIYSETVNDFTRDESPMVYKPAEEIIANIGDTATIEQSSVRSFISRRQNEHEVHSEYRLHPIRNVNAGSHHRECIPYIILLLLPATSF